jgi:pimeloyl-ACP methyl ester carboxylesterase
VNQQSVFVQNAAVNFIDTGAGTPTLFLHGNPDSSEMWAEVISQMQPRYRFLAPDLPGYGRSAFIPNFDTSLESMARWVDELVMNIGIRERLNLVAHDFGAQFGLAWAIRHSDRVRRMVIFNTNFFSDYKWHPLAQIVRTPILGELGLAMFSEAQYTRQLKNDAPLVPAAYIPRVVAGYTPSARKMALRLYRGTDSKKFLGWEDELHQMTARIPTLVMWGDRDPYAPAAWAERFGAQQVVHLPENSHWPMLEAPQVVAQRLDEFLA